MPFKTDFSRVVAVVALIMAEQLAGPSASARGHDAWWQEASAGEPAEVTTAIKDLARENGLTEAKVTAVFASVDVPLYQGTNQRIATGQRWVEAAVYARKLLQDQNVPGVDAALAAFDTGRFDQLLVQLDELAPVDGRPRRLQDPQWGVIVQVRMLVLTFTSDPNGAIDMLQQAQRSRADADRTVRYFLATLEAGTWYNMAERDTLLQSIYVYREVVLPLAPRDTAPDDWAAAQVGLCSVYGALARGQDDGFAEEAIRACEAALEVYRREDQPDHWAQTQLFLAMALEARGDDKALEHYRLAYEVFGPAGHGSSAYILDRIATLEARQADQSAKR